MGDAPVLRRRTWSTRCFSYFDFALAYYPGAQPVHVRITGDTRTGRLLGVQMLGAIATGVAKRIDTAATALYHHMSVEELSDLDLSYTPPLGSPWDILQVAAQAWKPSVHPASSKAPGP